MAVRPLVTTGVALLSAGALVAGTPALFVPHDEITVAASTAEAPAKKTLTQDQINLLALSVEGALGSFLDGYGGYYQQGVVTVPTAGYVVDGDKLVEPDEDTPDDAALYDSEGKRLYKDVNGTLVAATAGDMGENVQFYDAAGNKSEEYAYDPGNCAADGAACHDGFTGLAYYLSDNILPLDIVDNIFFEAGFTEFAFIGSLVAAAAVDAFDPTQRLQLSKRVEEFFTGGATLVAYSVIDDNLPDDAVGTWVKGLNTAFFSEGVTGAVTYVVDTVTALANVEEPEESSGLSLLAAAEETESTAETDSGTVSSTTLPNVGKLLSLPTNIESPVNLVQKSEVGSPVATLVEETAPEVEEAAIDEKVDAEVVAPAEPEQAEVKTKPKFNVLKDNPLSDLAGNLPIGKPTGKGGGAFAKGETNGQKFVKEATKSLENAFKPKTKAGADAQAKDKDTAKADAGSADGGSDSGSDA